MEEEGSSATPPPPPVIYNQKLRYTHSQKEVKYRKKTTENMAANNKSL